MQDAVKYDRGISYLNNYPAMLQQLQLKKIHSAAKKVIKLSSLTWVIVGDREKIEKGIQELNIGPIKFIDSEGKEVK